MVLNQRANGHELPPLRQREPPAQQIHLSISRVSHAEARNPEVEGAKRDASIRPLKAAHATLTPSVYNIVTFESVQESTCPGKVWSPKRPKTDVTFLRAERRENPRRFDMEGDCPLNQSRRII